MISTLGAWLKTNSALSDLLTGVSDEEGAYLIPGGGEYATLLDGTTRLTQRFTIGIRGRSDYGASDLNTALADIMEAILAWLSGATPPAGLRFEHVSVPPRFITNGETLACEAEVEISERY